MHPVESVGLIARGLPNHVDFNLYGYEPNHVLPIVVACIVGASTIIHIFQNFRYHYWHLTYFLVHGGVIFITGWIFRALGSFDTGNVPYYIVQIVLILAGPPIYAAAEYNVLGRLMHYLPMHAPLNPSRVFYFFLYLGIAVESLTGAGSGQIAGALPGETRYLIGQILVSVALVLQGCIEVIFMSFVFLMHRKAARSGMLTQNVRKVCITLYGTSTLVLLRCIFRAVENFQKIGCTAMFECGTISKHEWFLYVFECAPMVVYTYWLNFMHPGQYLPLEHQRYLDPDGKTERMGPGWIDRRSKLMTFVDPFDMKAVRHGRPDYARFWERPEEWNVCEDGTFALGTATNRHKKSKMAVKRSEKQMEKERKKQEAKAQKKEQENRISDSV
ncbi:Hypothetical protein R9X50_00295500 [Acrodontium crateriforme]|uniref:RTA1 domain protein n=1 Tax=Acrodontium crateriforme TaxID=150365 RepID=A0AAQ3M1T5_9PEZI|nr:Hypothetical protein R9X50_00295500 [Acrodontium crateriforme]